MSENYEELYKRWRKRVEADTGIIELMQHKIMILEEEVKAAPVYALMGYYHSNTKDKLDARFIPVEYCGGEDCSYCTPLYRKLGDASPQCLSHYPDEPEEVELRTPDGQRVGFCRICKRMKILSKVFLCKDCGGEVEEPELPKVK